jgi:hypothetical protein
MFEAHFSPNGETSPNLVTLASISMERRTLAVNQKQVVSKRNFFSENLHW